MKAGIPTNTQTRPLPYASRYGVARTLPSVPADWMSDADRDRSDRVMTALLAMKKLDIAALRQAYEGA